MIRSVTAQIKTLLANFFGKPPVVEPAADVPAARQTPTDLLIDQVKRANKSQDLDEFLTELIHKRGVDGASKTILAAIKRYDRGRNNLVLYASRSIADMDKIDKYEKLKLIEELIELNQLQKDESK